MDAKELRELIEFISKSNFTTFELEGEDFRLKVVKGVPADGDSRTAASPPADRSAAAAPSPATVGSEAPLEDAPQPASDLVEVRSPIVGTFYRAPSPGAEPFVQEGDRVKKGQVLCIVEAMKLMNEIEAEMDAEVVEIVAVNGQPVEYGEVLFRLRPL